MHEPKSFSMNRSLERNTYYQKLYPTINNEDLLEFRIPPNVKANMCLSDVLLRFVIQLPEITTNNIWMVAENLIGHKQFSSVEIRINGDAVTRRNCSNEYFLGAYFQYLTNYSIDYATTSCNAVGLFDSSEIGTDGIIDIAKNTGLATDTINAMLQERLGVNGDGKLEIVMPIDASIFTSNQNLMSNTPIEISFERTTSKQSTLVTAKTDTSGCPSVLTLEDAYIIVPYTIDTELQQAEKMAVSHPIKLKYDDYAINRFNIPKDSPNVRLANLMSGPLPHKIFYGIMELDSYTGSFEKSSTRFQVHGVKKMTLYVDGNVLSGYPMTIEENAITLPFVRFQENTNRYMNCYSSRTLTQRSFRDYHFLYSAKLDPETSGSLTFEFDFSSAPDKDLVLVTCCVYDRTIEMDSFRNFKII